MKVPNLEVFSDLSKVNTTVIPILWLEEGIDELGPEIVGVLKQAVIDPKEWKQIILYIWTGKSFVLRTDSELTAYFRSVRHVAVVVHSGHSEVSPEQGQCQQGGESERTCGEVDHTRPDQRHQLPADHSNVGQWRELEVHHSDTQPDFLGGSDSSLCSAQQR